MYLDLKPIPVITNVSDLDTVRIPSHSPIFPNVDAILKAFVFYLMYVDLADILTHLFISDVSIFL